MKIISSENSFNEIIINIIDNVIDNRDVSFILSRFTLSPYKLNNSINH
jgi:hypothetical protein